MKTTNTQIQQLPATVERLTKASGLRLPNFVLSEFTGKEPLDRFLDHLHNLLLSSDVPAQYWLKQQCFKDSHASDALVSAEDTHAKLLGPDVSKASDHDFKQHSEACVNTLREKCGKPRHQQICDLLST